MVEQRARTRTQELRSNFEQRYGEQVTQVKLAQAPEPEGDTYAYYEWTQAKESVQELQDTDPRTWNIANRLANPIDKRLEERRRRLDKKLNYPGGRVNELYNSIIHDEHLEAIIAEQDEILRAQYRGYRVDYIGAPNMYPNPIISEEGRAVAAD